MDYPIRTLGQLRPILKGFRKSAGMTQAMVASHLGVTQQTYAQLEANPTAVSVERLFKVLRVLGVGFTLIATDAESRKEVAAIKAASPGGMNLPVREQRQMALTKKGNTSSRRSAKDSSTSKRSANAEPTDVSKRTAGALKKPGTTVSARRPVAETKKDRQPLKAVIKKRENW